jgi:hypothetical protein
MSVLMSVSSYLCSSWLGICNAVSMSRVFVHVRYVGILMRCHL